MKISVVKGENRRVNYIQLGLEKAVRVTDFSDNEGLPFHAVFWNADTELNKALGLIRKLYDDARCYQRPAQEMFRGEPFDRIVALGKKITVNTLRLYPVIDFFEYEDPSSMVTREVISVGLLTPHYALHFCNATLREGSLHEKINLAQISVYSNIDSTIAEIIMNTSPAFAAQKDFAEPKLLLTQKLDQLLSQYQKPVKLN